MSTPPFVPNPDQAKQTMLQALARILPQMGQGMSSAKSGGNPLVFPGMPGASLQAPQVPNVRGGLPSMPGAPGMPTGNQPQPIFPSQSGLYKSGFEFESPSGRNAAVATSAIQGVADLIGQVGRKKEEKTRAQAENYMSQIMAAQQAGDKQTLDLLLTDPKVVKSLEKGLNYMMPKVPGEPPPPEALGVHSAIKKSQQQQQRLPAPNTPGGVAFPRLPQSASATQGIQDILSYETLKRLQQDPNLAATLGTRQLGGGALGSQEEKDKERYQSGLAMSPAADRQVFLAHQDMLDKFNNENKQLLMELASRENIAKLGAKTGERQAAISAGPIYYRAKIAKDIADSQIKIKAAVMNGQVGQANKIAMQTLTSLINNARTNAEKAKKDGDEDLMNQYLKDMNGLQEQYNKVEKTTQFNADDIINNLFNE